MRKLLFAGVSAVSLCATPGMALAQPDNAGDDGASAEQRRQAPEGAPVAQTPPADSPQATGEGQLGDIVITAQRRSESAQRAAIAIDVVGGNELIEQGINNAAELTQAVPALTIQQIGSQSTSFIRGVGNFSTFQSADAAVAYNYDGVYIGRPQATGNTFFDLERVEVLKGPQGTLYGRNATAGVINVIPARPRFDAVSGYATASYGNFNEFVAEGAVNVPLGDTRAIRVSGSVVDRDGYLSDGSADLVSQAARLQALVEISPDLSIRLQGDYTHVGGTGTGLTFLNRQTLNVVTGAFTVVPTGIPLSDGTGSPSSQAFYTSLPTGGFTVPATIPPGIAGRNRDPFPDLFRDNEFFGFHAEINWNTSIGTLTLIPSVRGDRIRNLSPAGGFPITIDQRDSQHSVEARLAGSAGRFEYTLGAYYYHEEINVRAGTSTFGTNTIFQAPQEVTTNSIAVFARLVANVNDRLRLVGGIRYTHDDKSLDALVQRVSVSCAPGFTCPTAVLPIPVTTIGQLPFTVPAPGTTINGPTPNSRITRDPDLIFDQERSDGEVTWRAAVEFDIEPASMLYASVETGFRAGGFNLATGFETFEPETITAYTIGAKNRFFANRWQLNIEAFRWEYRNQQVAHPGVDSGFRPTSITENIGASRIQGVEIDTRFLATPNTVLSAQVAYLDTEFEEFVYRVPSPLRPNSACAVSPAVGVAGFFDVNCAGLPAYNSPEWTVNLGVEQTIPLDRYELVLNADTQYRSERYVGFDYQPEQLQEGSWTSNAQVRFGPADGRWALAAYVRNIENDRLKSAVVLFGGLTSAYTTAPRTYGVRASVRF